MLEFKNVIAGAVALFLLLGVGGAVISKTSDVAAFKEANVLTLTPYNHLVIDSEVSAVSMKRAKDRLLEIDLRLPKDEPIYIILDTPGGDVYQGLEFISTMRSAKHRVHTITKFAASMGFVIAQFSETRYITFSGVAMSHRASGGISGDFFGNFHTRLAFWERIFNKIDLHISDRMSVSLQKYREMVRDEWWAVGSDVVEAGAADEVVGVICNKELLDLAGCPL